MIHEQTTKSRQIDDHWDDRDQGSIQSGFLITANSVIKPSSWHDPCLEHAHNYTKIRFR